MTMYSYVPRPPLCNLVHKFWMYESYQQGHAQERVLPTGSMQLIINLRDTGLRIYETADPTRSRNFGHALLTGPYSEAFVIDTASQEAIMGVHFRPGGAFPFLGWPAAELRNLHLGLDDLWGANAAELREHLLAASNHQTRFRLLESFLLKQARMPILQNPAVAFALRELPRHERVAELTEQIGFSQRRFNQLFSQEVGLTPKVFWRIQRFQTVLQTVHGQICVNWAELAQNCGYYDQAHFIHDFQNFTGVSPTDYLKLHTEHQNHVPLPS